MTQKQYFQIIEKVGENLNDFLYSSDERYRSHLTESLGWTPLQAKRFAFSGFFTIHFKSCNVSITTAFLPLGSGRPDDNAQKIQRKGSKKSFLAHPFFLTGVWNSFYYLQTTLILSLLSDQFLFNGINLICSIFITNE